jgi:hypothetical protein
MFCRSFLLLLFFGKGQVCTSCPTATSVQVDADIAQVNAGPCYCVHGYQLQLIMEIEHMEGENSNRLVTR